MQRCAIFWCFGFGCRQSAFAATKWFKKYRKEEVYLFQESIEHCLDEPDIPNDKLYFGSEMAEALRFEFGVDCQIDLGKSASIFRNAVGRRGHGSDGVFGSSLQIEGSKPYLK
jgi:hypothetical protein